MPDVASNLNIAVRFSYERDPKHEHTALLVANGRGPDGKEIELATVWCQWPVEPDRHRELRDLLTRAISLGLKGKVVMS